MGPWHPYAVDVTERLLASLSPADQKKALALALHARLYAAYPDIAGFIITLILAMDNPRILALLGNRMALDQIGRAHV